MKSKPGVTISHAFLPEKSLHLTNDFPGAPTNSRANPPHCAVKEGKWERGKQNSVIKK